MEFGHKKIGKTLKNYEKINIDTNNWDTFTIM